MNVAVLVSLQLTVHNIYIFVGSDAPASPTLLQKTVESEPPAEESRPAVPALLYSSDEDVPEKPGTSLQGKRFNPVTTRAAKSRQTDQENSSDSALP